MDFFSGSAADMLKKYGQSVPEQEPQSSLEEAQAAKKRMEADQVCTDEGCTEARAGADGVPRRASRSQRRTTRTATRTATARSAPRTTATAATRRSMSTARSGAGNAPSARVEGGRTGHEHKKEGHAHGGHEHGEGCCGGHDHAAKEPSGHGHDHGDGRGEHAHGHEHKKAEAHHDHAACGGDHGHGGHAHSEHAHGHGHEHPVATQLRAGMACQHVEVAAEGSGCGQKLQIAVVSTAFAGLPLIKQHRLVQETAKEELAKVHAFNIKTYTPQKWATYQERVNGQI